MLLLRAPLVAIGAQKASTQFTTRTQMLDSVQVSLWIDGLVSSSVWKNMTKKFPLIKPKETRLKGFSPLRG